MNRSPKIAGLILLLCIAFTQSAAAWHKAEHKAADHTQVCQVFTLADHACAVQHPVVSLAIFQFIDSLPLQLVQSSSTTSFLNFHTRAPPIEEQITR